MTRPSLALACIVLVASSGPVHAASICQHLLATLSNAGELGTVANWDQHNLADVFDKPAKELSEALGEPLAPDRNQTVVVTGR